MLDTHTVIYKVGLLILVVAMLVSCAQSGTGVGSIAIPAERLAFQASDKQQTWQTNDMVINYQNIMSGTGYLFTGKVSISDRISYSYPIAFTLNIYVNLLNQDGLVVSKYNIGASKVSYETTPNDIPFKVSLPQLPGVTSFVFSYEGTFRESGGVNIKNRIDELLISYAPFVK